MYVYVYDVALIASSTEELGAMLHELNRTCEATELKMNLSKTKIRNQDTIYDLKINDKKIDGAESAIYLEQKISSKNAQEKEIELRISLV